MKKILLIGGIVAVMVVGWIFLKNNKLENELVPFTPPIVSSEPTASPSPVVSKNIVVYTDSGFAPNMITIKSGDEVTWKNESGRLMWVASAMHPLHRAYPGTDISACGTQTLIPMFDSCVGVASGQSWSFVFKNVGTWGYHDHLNSSKFGKVIVE